MIGTSQHKRRKFVDFIQKAIDFDALYRTISWRFFIVGGADNALFVTAVRVIMEGKR
jgi:hypothetical protein